MAAPPFKVKASYPYESAHDDDLKFPAGQIITVTREEDADWYEGEYTDGSGSFQTGLFPKNFVEKYEPAPPPRPVRGAAPKAAPAPVKQEVKEPEPEEDEDEEDEEEEAAASPPAQVAAPPVIQQAPVKLPEQPKPAPAPKPVEQPVKAAPSQSTKAPPPVAEKPSSFKDRIAAFNKASAAPVAPFKPSNLGSTFIKKPFVAPPPSRDAYIPPARDQVVAKVYRREEDPEIAERQAEDLANAERAGLVPTGGEEAEEEAPKAVSLKERIALLQKQQAEQAARRDVPGIKEKPKKPPKKRPDPELEEGSGDTAPRGSSDVDREIVEPRKIPRSVKPPEHIVSDGNEADHSAAGETTEDADADEEEEIHHPPPKAPAAEEEEEGEEEETEEEEMDEESRHQLALRERMAKLSGGMGMPGMFGPPGGMPMMGMASRPAKPKKQPSQSEYDREPTSPLSAPRVPVIPMPGLNRAPTQDSTEDTTRPDEHDEHDDEEEPVAAPPPLPVASKPPTGKGKHP
jgi:hypothetical protein